MEAKTLRVRGCELAYWVRPADTDQWIVFLHGAGCDHSMFDQQFSSMPQDRNLLAWDARGHGLSPLDAGLRFDYQDMIEDFSALVTHHHMTDVVLVGQSMGGNLAQDLIARHPDVVTGAVLIDCTNNTQTLTTMERIALALARAILAVTPWKSLISMSAKASGENDYTREYMRKSLSQTGRTVFLDAMTSLNTALNPDPTHRFSFPVLLILGEKDKTGNISKAMRQWPHLDPNAVLHVIANASHNSNMDAPEPVNQLITSYRSDIGPGPQHQ